MAKDPNKKGFFGVDMAVGVIIGGAFTAIVTALTGGILQPLINWLIGGRGGLEAARTILGEPVYMETEVGGQIIKQIDWAKTNYIDWGAFISAVINFLLVALILFIIIKVINNVHRKGVEAKAKLEEKAKKEEAPAEEEKKAE